MVDVGGPSPFGQCYPWPGHLVLEVDWASHGKWTYRHNSTMVSDSLLLLWGPALTSLTDGLWYGSQCQINPFFFFSSSLQQQKQTRTEVSATAACFCLTAAESWGFAVASACLDLLGAVDSGQSHSPRLWPAAAWRALSKDHSIRVKIGPWHHCRMS